MPELDVADVGGAVELEEDSFVRAVHEAETGTRINGGETKTERARGGGGGVGAVRRSAEEVQCEIVGEAASLGRADGVAGSVHDDDIASASWEVCANVRAGRVRGVVLGFAGAFDYGAVLGLHRAVALRSVIGVGVRIR